jgi:nucleoside-diphosphate-sugar epimerase
MKTDLSLPCSPSEADDFLSAPSPRLESMLKDLAGDFMVLGAAGKMGLHVCLMLRKALDAIGDSRRVIAVSRFSQPAAVAEFENYGIVTAKCDLSDEAQLNALESVPNIIFMAGAKFGTSKQPELLQKMNVEMPSMVARRFRESRITAFSTGCVYPYYPTASYGPDETVACNHPIGSYAQSCLGREQAFLNVSKAFGTPVSLIRLNYAVEFRYGVPVDLAHKILADEPINLEMGHANLIWQRDAVLHSLLAHGEACAGGFIINVTRQEILKIRDLATRLGELLGRTPQFAGEEAPTAWISNPAKAVRLFGEPETSVEQILQYVAAWQLHNLPTLNKPTGFEKRDGNF